MKITDLNLSFIKYFYDSVQAQSLTRAAELNNVSRPAISQSIRRLEEVIGAQVISHRKNQFQLTERGEEIFLHAQKLLASAEDFALLQSSKNEGFRLKIASSQSLFERFCMEIMPRPAEVHFGSSSRVREMIEKDLVDFGFIIDDDLNQHLEKVKVHSGQFVIYQLPKDQLQDGINCTSERPEVSHLKKVFKIHFKEDLKVLNQIDSWTSLVQFTNAGHGPSLVPDFLIKQKKGSLIGKLKKFDVICIYKASRLALPRHRQFIKSLKTS